MTEFTKWRSLVDGAEISAIPDSQVYLQDDWGDNKLTDRDDSGTTTYNGVEGVYRPEWKIDDGSPEADDNQLQYSSGDALHAEIELNLDETVTWEFENVDGSASGGESSGQYVISLMADTTDHFAGDETEIGYSEGYELFMRDDDAGDLFRFRRNDDAGSDNETLISADNPTDGRDIKVTREPDGTWQLFLDGDSVGGTEVDDTYTDPIITGYVARGNRNVIVSVDEMKVF